MTLTQHFQHAGSTVALWAVQNPTAARLILILVPFLAAAITAVLTNQPVYACPSVGGAGCGGDPT
jgi:hypothetical protein